MVDALAFIAFCAGVQTVTFAVIAGAVVVGRRK